MPLKVIGAGFGRTGTMSLTAALEQLGLGRCNHMASADKHPLWIAAAEGKPDWERIFEGYDCTTDYPSCNFWRELAAFYPDAKILLSVRDPDKWFDSTQETIFSKEVIESISNSPSRAFFEKAVWVGIKDRIHDRNFMVAHFKRHIEEVKRAIPQGRLLVFDVREGWAPLCAFLGVAVPQAPFPRVNEARATKALLQLMAELHESFPTLAAADIGAIFKAVGERNRSTPDVGPEEMRAQVIAEARAMNARKA